MPKNETGLLELYDTILRRKDADPASSYTAALSAKGADKIAQKLGEEAVEAVIEAVRGDRDRLKEESADLLFHLLVLWAARDIRPEEVFDILAQRTGTSGHAEKAGRGGIHHQTEE